MLITLIALYAKALLPLADAKFALLDIAKNELTVGTFGVFVVAILSILMSTIDSLLFSSGTIFAFDVYSRVKNLLFSKSTAILQS